MNKSTKFSPEVRERAVRMVQVLMPDGVINGDSRSFVALLCWGRVLLIFVTLSSWKKLNRYVFNMALESGVGQCLDPVYGESTLGQGYPLRRQVEGTR